MNLLLLGIVLPLILTVIIETLVACIFFRSREDLVIVALAQCITNPILNLILIVLGYFGIRDLMPATVLLEIGAVIVEFWIYRKYFSKANKNKAALVAVIANIIALIIGGLIMNLVVQ